MGRSSREKPQRLAEKLLLIRESLGLSQTEMIARLVQRILSFIIENGFILRANLKFAVLGLQDKLRRTDISKFELGQSEPSLLVLLEYGRLANVSLDVLANDALDLPPRN